MLKSWGATNFAGPSFAQCRGPRDVGFALTFGTGLGSPEPTDIENTDCLVLIGSHLGENMHNLQVQEFANAVERRIPIIVVDPRFSVAASKARYWLPIRPGTDLALLLAWCNVLVTEGRYDSAFVEKYGHGFDKFAAEIKDRTPEWAAAETGIDAAMIRTTAREFSSHRPATLIHPGRRVNWNGDDTQRSRAVALLSALLGNWGRKGGLFLPAGMKVAPYPLPKYPKSDKPLADNPNGEKYPVRRRGDHDRHPRGDADRQALPDQGLVRLLVEHHPRAAEPGRDPEGDRQPRPAGRHRHAAKRDRRLRRRRAARDHVPRALRRASRRLRPHRLDVAAAAGRRGAARAEAGLVDREAARGKLGIADCMPFKDMEEYLRYRIEKSGMSWADLVRDGVIMGKEEPITVEEGLELAFDTPSKKVEFWSDQLQAKGFDPVPKYTPPAKAPDGYLRLITGRAPVHTFSRTQTNPYLLDLMPENEVWVNTATAARSGLRNGQYVLLRNQDGAVSNRVRVKATQRIRPDCVYMVYGFGHTSKMLKGAYLKGASTAQLTTKYVTDPIMGGTSIHSNFVTFVKDV